MNGKSGLCGVILAAGMSSRMGRDKALLSWPPTRADADFSSGTTLLSASIFALRAHTQAVIVVAGNNSNQLSPIIAACSAILARNPAPERGQFSSMQVGLRQVMAQGYDAAMITPVDCPPLSEATLARLRVEFERAISAGLWGVAPENNGRRGHPLLINRQFIEAFLSASLTSNAREVKNAHAQSIQYISVPDTLVSVDVNTPEQYAALSAQTRSRHS